MSETVTKQEVFSLIPKRASDSSKHDYGKLLALCGSTYYRGAAFLCTKAALRCGAGIVTLATIEKVISAIAPCCPECTYLPLTESPNGTISFENCRFILKNAKKYNAMLIGCGLAIDSDTKSLVKALIHEYEGQLIIDADGLNVLSECPDLIKTAKRPPIITPHHGEMARLCHRGRSEIAEAPLVYSQRFAEEYNCIVVLKSHITYIATPDGNIAINSETGNPGLARGGSGDVLAGMISSFCAQGASAFDAAKCGVYLHGLCADICAEKLSEQGMLPSDLLDALASVFKN